VEFEVDGNTVRIVRRDKKKGRAKSRGERAIEALRGTATKGYTTDEIMKMFRGE
jgi:hypothetical protein